MPFVKGKSGNVKGRPTGALNVITKTIREGVLETYHTLQSTPGHTLLDFAMENPKEFWSGIAVKLIPTELKAEIQMPEPIKIIFTKDADSQPIGTNPESNFGIPGESGSL
jgi:hypothetical protein